ncbi:phosphatidylserine/phosphatidylglycerophosphate/cardiolipin synthase-like enzyme [Nakamurella sp. UYEF19]|uniref:phospholipase D-like domain-containing protein n=1 Tax=Nakamurella sp. UYEF19 TaxID=1756392 RepID=UPI003390E305
MSRFDDLVGGGLERAVERHHRRRLGRLGQLDALDSKALGTDGWWVPGGRPPRDGNDVQVLIDGQTAFAAMHEALMAAKSHVHIAGWHLTPEFRLLREAGTPTLADILKDLARTLDVRVLLWAGPPLPAFKPTRPMMKEVRAALTDGSQVQCILDARERTLHCHHEKLVIIDDETAFVGGIDLSNLDGDRWDHHDHPPRRATGWHDVTTRLQGPIVADVAEHFRDRWQEVAGEALPRPIRQPAAGAVTVQLWRTVPEKTYRFAPEGEFSILAGYLRALRAAENFIYLENQFLWSTEIVDVLIEKLKTPPCNDFRMLIILPMRPSSGADTTRGQLGRLLQADNGRGHLLPVTVRSHDEVATGALYVHAKVGIIDDRWLTIGSGNLNEHSLFNDTEVNIATLDPALAKGTRLRLWAEHLERPEADIDGDPTTVIDTIWAPLARDQLARQHNNLPATARVTHLPAVSRRTERLVGPARGLLVDG